MRTITLALELIFGLHKSLYVNLRFFGIKGLAFPILISKNTLLRSLSGSVELGCFKTGVVKIGFSNVDCFDGRYQRAIFKNTGSVTFKGKAFIGSGAYLESSGKLVIGNRFQITADSKVICKNVISIGDDVLVSWGCQLTDSDFHEIYYSEDEKQSKVGTVDIGDKVWLCSGVKIFKNTKVGNNSVVAAESLCVGKVFEGGSLIAGTPAQFVKPIDGWRH